jgi:hypothetical protein
MKTPNLLFPLKFNAIGKLIRVAVFISGLLFSNFIFAQNSFFRGNANDDMYYNCASNNKSVLCRFTEYGEKIDIRANFGGLIEYAEPTEGTLFGRMSSSIYRSTDAGLTFSPIATPPEKTVRVYGGTIKGECIIYTYTTVGGLLKNVQLYKSFDNGLTQLLVKDSIHSIPLWPGQIGSVSGEMYFEPFIDGTHYLCHSLDFGATFDTIPYDPSIFQQPGRNFAGLCSGTRLGELYLVSSSGTCPITDFYIYRSVDFGKTWKLQSEKSFTCNDIMRYSCGRESGTFYILHEKKSSSAQFLTLEICASSDSGRTFNTHEHLISHSLSIQDINGFRPVTIWPNPVSDFLAIQFYSVEGNTMEIQLRSAEGITLKDFVEKHPVTGTNMTSIDCHNLVPGMYFLVLKDKNGTTDYIRFLKTR